MEASTAAFMAAFVAPATLPGRQTAFQTMLQHNATKPAAKHAHDSQKQGDAENFLTVALPRGLRSSTVRSLPSMSAFTN
jgi:hypothetical protein